MIRHFKRLALAAMAAATVCGTALASPADNTGGGFEASALPPGSALTTYDIVVSKFGKRVRGSHGAKVFPVAPGHYIALFPVAVTGCTYVATLGRATRDGGETEPPGYISVAGASGRTNGVFIETRGNFGLRSRNRAFHLLVAC